MLVFAGCSGGPTLEEWAQQADAVCLAINDEVDALPAPGNDLATFSAYIGRVQALLQEESDRLRALEPPDGGEMPTSMADYLDRQVELADDLGTAANDGDADRVRALLDQSARELGPLGRTAAEEAGVTECASTGAVAGSGGSGADTTVPATEPDPAVSAPVPEGGVPSTTGPAAPGVG